MSSESFVYFIYVIAYFYSAQFFTQYILVLLTVCTAVLTQLIEVRVAAISSWYRADQTGLQKCCPLVHQASLTAHIILIGEKIAKINLRGYFIYICQQSSWNCCWILPCTAVRFWSR